jgi:hypothetical protein
MWKTMQSLLPVYNPIRDDNVWRRTRLRRRGQPHRNTGAWPEGMERRCGTRRVLVGEDTPHRHPWNNLNVPPEPQLTAHQWWPERSGEPSPHATSMGCRASGGPPPLARQVEIEQGTLICTMRGRIWRATAPRGDLAGDPRGKLPPMDLSCYLEAIMDEGGQRRGKDRQRK